TFGVVGVWHVDAGSAAPAANGVTWSPLAGAASAWMGMRRHGDTQYVDPITHSAFNDDLLQFTGVGYNGVTGSNHGFPGYGSQMDQMLFRDIAMTTSQSLTVSFKYRTRMSTSIGEAA